MSTIQLDRKLIKRLFLAFSLLVLCSLPFQSFGQEFPPKPITLRVKALSTLQFGAFTQGSSGGTVILTAQNARSSTGDVILLNMGYTYSPAIMQVQALKGTVVSIATGLTGTLTGPGGTMNLVVGGTYPPSPFVVTTDISEWMDIQVGGTLTVGTPGANPAGSYLGTFNVTFIQE